MGLLQRNPNCGERGWCLLLIKPQNSVFLITCYWSLPLSTFLWPWRLNGWNYCKRGHSTDSIRDNDALPRTQYIHDNRSSFRHHMSCGSNNWAFNSGKEHSGRSDDSSRIESTFDCTIPGTDRSSFTAEIIDGSQVGASLPAACQPARRWSQKISVSILITCNKYCCQCHVAGILDCWVALVDLSEDMATQVMVELLPTPSSSPSGNFRTRRSWFRHPI